MGLLSALAPLAVCRPVAVLASPSPSTGLVLSDRFAQFQIEPGHPESPQRYLVLHDYLQAAGLLSTVQVLRPATEVMTAMRRIHTAQHINAIQTSSPAAHLLASAAVGGITEAVSQVCSGRLKNAFCASRPPGHHALNTGREEGFCFYNHIAIAARFAQQEFGLRRILIVDWDYHHGNGTQDAFYNDPDVLFFSSHDLNAYPGTGSAEMRGAGAGFGYNINVPLDCGTTDEEIIAAYEENLLPAVERFKPELVLVSAGFDSRKDDRLGCFAITDEGFRELTRLVMDIADRHCAGRLVSLLEGGYNLQGNAQAAVAHVEALMGQ